VLLFVNLVIVEVCPGNSLERWVGRDSFCDDDVDSVCSAARAAAGLVDVFLVVAIELHAAFAPLLATAIGSLIDTVVDYSSLACLSFGGRLCGSLFYDFSGDFHK